MITHHRLVYDEIKKMYKGEAMSFYFSPDMGNFEHVGDKFYFEDGDITRDDIVIRMMPTTRPEGKRYSQWTKEERKEIRANVAKELAEQEATYEKEEKEQADLIASARKKLTEDEFNAVQDSRY